jgi:hypothetical protein
MAKEQKRRINLAWSPARWKEEHDRLSRAEALLRMAAEHVRYDVAPYEKHLPRRFDGYLIRTSRRLGMEGLRQRHCVASYHGRMQSGACAIATVFADKRRWTAELHLTGKTKTPLRIAQIKSRYNQLPTASIRKRIHDILGITLPAPSATGTAPPDPAHLYMENLRRILPVLAEHQVETVTVSFDGSGDSGSIQDIAYHPQDDGVSELAIEHVHTDRFFDDGAWRTVVAPKQTTMNEAIETLTYDYLEETNVDWYNNDGGFGELIINVAEGTVQLEVNVRFTQTSTEYNAARDIATGEAI